MAGHPADREDRPQALVGSAPGLELQHKSRWNQPTRIFRPIAYLSRMRRLAFDPCIPTGGTKVPDRPE
jgi:hypothetical protein